jgi:hypothetical protein
VHRLRANCFQNTYDELIAEGKTDQEARCEVARKGGHKRTEVSYSYVPKRN